MERMRVEEFGESNDKDYGLVNLVFLQSFSLKILSGSSTFRGYKGIYSSVCEKCEKSGFIQTGYFGDSASQVERVASLSRELTAQPDYTFCLVVLQLS